MTVAVNIPRGGVEVTWEPGDYVGPVVIRATNMENGDVGVMKDSNDGRHFVTWPTGTWNDLFVIYEDTPEPVDPENPPVVDNTLPEVPKPGDLPHPDNTLPGDLPVPTHPIVLPDPNDPHVEHHLGKIIDQGEITVTVA